jgi:hypothetical protein
MKVTKDAEFTNDTMVGSGGILYALANKTTRTDEDGGVFYEADAIEIQNAADAQKAIKKFLLDNLKITTATGNTFDANESSRNNMMSALMAAEVMNETSANWKLADNTIALVTVSEMKEALALAIAATGEIVLNA